MKMRSVIICGLVVAFAALFLGCADQTQSQNSENIPKTTQSLESRVECPVGSFVRTQEGEFKVTGIERITVAGKSMDMCCMEVKKDVERSKFCHDMVVVDLGMWGYRNAVFWTTDEETGKFYKAAEGFEKDGRYCLQSYDVSGASEGMMCTYKQGTQICTVIYDEAGKVQAEGCC